MGMLRFMITAFDGAASLARRSISSFSNLETANADMLFGKDGSVATVIRFNGTRRMGSVDDLKHLCDSLGQDLQTAMSRNGQAIQFHFTRDPDKALDVVRGFNAPQRAVATHQDLDLDAFFTSRENYLARYIVSESVHIVLWTRPSVMSKAEARRVKAERESPPWWPRAEDSQDLDRVAQLVISKHRSLISGFKTAAKTSDLDIEILSAAEALRAIRDTVYIGSGHEGWSPRLPGDVTLGAPQAGGRQAGQPWAREKTTGGDDMSHLLWPTLDEQIFDKGAEIVGGAVKIDGRYFVPIDISMGQRELTRFNDLLNHVRGEGDLPWRASFLVEGSASVGSPFLSMLSSIIGVTNKAENGLYKRAIDGLNAIRMSEDAVPRIRVSFATWGHTERSAIERAGRLEQAIQGWGSCLTSTAMGDPLDGVCSSMMGLGVRSTARSGYLPLRDVLYMMPFMREASPFQSGPLLQRTEDGRAFPISFGSSRQNTFNDLISAPPGSGKSMWTNGANLAFLLSPGATFSSNAKHLPRLRIIEIGRTSAGLIKLMQEALPPRRRDEVLYHRMRMTDQDAINPFDTHPGLRYPLPLHRSFLINLIALLVTPIGETKPPTFASELAGLLIDQAYESLSDRTRNGTPTRTGNARPYTPGEDLVVDNAIREFGITVPHRASWWSLVDQFAARGQRRLMTFCQRQATPRLEDMLEARNSQAESKFGTAVTASGQPLLDAFEQGIISALREYPILTQPTKLDFGEARVVSIDLAAVAIEGGAPANKQTNVVYMLARHVLVNEFFVSRDDLSLVPDDYLEYYQKLVHEIETEPKRFVMDEFHRTNKAPGVRAQVVVDQREGRKHNLQIALISQMADDFDTDMKNMATGFWNFGVTNAEEGYRTQKMLGLTDAATHALIHSIKGPRDNGEGAPVLAVLQMKDGTHEHVLFNTLGPHEVWALSTTNEDAALRDRLYELLGMTETWKRLATRFPSGSAKKEVERRIKAVAQRGMNAEKATEGVIDRLVDEIARDPGGSQSA